MTDISFPDLVQEPHGRRALPVLTVTHDGRRDWRPAPIDPAWILAGTPVAEFIPLGRGNDGYSTVTMWRCSEGCFNWRFGWEEVVHIIGGEVEVTASDGQETRLRTGSVALFQAGTTAIWNVVRPVEKVAVCRRAMNPRLSRLIRLVRRPWMLAAAALAPLAERLALLEPLLA